MSTSNDLQTEYLNCPLCEGEIIFLGYADIINHPIWHEGLPKKLEWMECQRCGHIHTRGYWTPTGLDEVFRKTQANQITGGDNNPPDSKRAQWLPVVKNAIRHSGGYAALFDEDKYWCDIGCGNGALLMTARDFGFSAFGLDTRKETVERIQALGFQANQADFMQAQFDRPLQIISMMDVLEHLPFPRQVLQKAHDSLAPAGLLIISLPDASCSTWKIMDHEKNNPYWMEIEHHHNFSRNLLMQLLIQQGFDIVDFDIPNRYKAQMEIYAKKRTI